MERALVTGGTGFIGKALVRHLVEQGRRVFVFSRSAEAGSLPCVTALDGDLRAAASVEAVVRAVRPDLVFHLAAAGTLPGGWPAQEVFETNVIGTANLLHALEGQGCRALVHAGSGIEYGPHDEAVREGDRLCPRNPYAVAKAASSLMVMQSGVPAAVVRIFAAYGPGEHSQRLFPYLLACRSRDEIPRLSHGWQRRDFIHVEDIVRLLVAAPAALGHALHAATGVAWSVREAVEMFRDAGGGHPPLFGGRESLVEDPPLYLGSRERTTALTGWVPCYDLRSGIEQTLGQALRRAG